MSVSLHAFPETPAPATVSFFLSYLRSILANKIIKMKYWKTFPLAHQHGAIGRSTCHTSWQPELNSQDPTKKEMGLNLQPWHSYRDRRITWAFGTHSDPPASGSQSTGILEWSTSNSYNTLSQLFQRLPSPPACSSALSNSASIGPTTMVQACKPCCPNAGASLGFTSVPHQHPP